MTPRIAERWGGSTLPTPRDAYDAENERHFRAQLARELATIAALKAGSLYVNVKDSPYNAKGDGTTDDTDAIQSALDDVATAGGGVVFAPQGTYLVSGLLLRSRVELAGEGWGTVIKQAAASHVVDVTSVATSGAATTLTDTTKSWTVNEHQWKSVYISSGTGSGQVRMILSNTSDTLTIGMETAVGAEDFSPSPDNTSHYQILTPTPLIGLYDGDTEMTVVRRMKLDGNGGNQTALNPAIYWDNGGGSFTIGDANHRAEYLWIDNTKGSGIIKGPSCRECYCVRVTVREAGRHSIITEPGGGTDNRNLHCISQASRFSGFVANGSNEHWTDCKAFGAGDHPDYSATSGNASGFLVQDHGKMMLACESQENVEHGFLFVDAHNSVLIGRAGSNGNDGVRLFDASNNRIILQAKGDESVPSGRIQDYAVNASGGTVENNMIDVTTDNTHATGVTSSSLEGNDNDLRVNNRWKGPFFSQYGEVSSAHEHIKWGKGTSPDTDNAYFAWKTDASDPVKSTLEGYDGTSTLTFQELDFANAINNLGSGNTVPRVPIYTNSSRPAAGNPGCIIYNSDAGKGQMDDGSNWNDLW